VRFFLLLNSLADPGADNTGQFLGVGKTTWFKINLKAGSDPDAFRKH